MPLKSRKNPTELIDTDVLVDIQRGFGAAADWFGMDPDVGFGLIDATAFTEAATEVTSLSPVESVTSSLIRVGDRGRQAIQNSNDDHGKRQ